MVGDGHIMYPGRAGWSLWYLRSFLLDTHAKTWFLERKTWDIPVYVMKMTPGNAQGNYCPSATYSGFWWKFSLCEYSLCDIILRCALHDVTFIVYTKFSQVSGSWLFLLSRCLSYQAVFILMSAYSNYCIIFSFFILYDIIPKFY